MTFRIAFHEKYPSPGILGIMVSAFHLRVNASEFLIDTIILKEE